MAASINVPCPSCQTPIEVAVELRGQPKADPRPYYQVTVQVTDDTKLREHLRAEFQRRPFAGVE